MAKKGTELVSWKQQLAEQAAQQTKMVESIAVGQFFNTAGGILKLNGSPVAHNQVGALIIAWCFEHAYYEDDFDPKAPTSPVCFAFGTTEDNMAPHAGSTKPQAKTCKECKWNKFGTADKGKGKACKNVVRMALLPAGSFDKEGNRFTVEADPEHYQSATPSYWRVSVTSVKAFAAYVRAIAAQKLVPHVVISRIRLVPDDKNQHATVFEALESIPDEVGEVVMARHEELQESIGFPYQPPADEDRDERPTKSRKGKY